ncbi:MAG TPA: 3-isopropylmalate dehydratase large subunit [bacterium]|nr:3-isopropylmalate dehydratase large subunit [bacterium]HNT64373.1 3-isopropylmalate dehydratase large subunit [bacterium]HOX85363.1 3-isopropylmalate dehydratase large subunit [bacterium]HPG44522.1 3-isopropylmalate dehydratase large subunit [bacterium]HPM97080.1 3-isopropylmalate dehydratase large subunit [bacterium]
MGQTFAEKVLGRLAGKRVTPGEIVQISPDYAMSHDNTAAIVKTWRQIGVKRVKHADRHVVILDHCVPAANEKFAQNHKEIREFVKEQGIRHFYDISRGICHQVLSEEGFALPGKLIVGSDSHTTTYGAFGAFSTGIGRSEMAAIMATGQIWLRTPETIKIEAKGKAPVGISAKDIILHIIGAIGADGALYKSVWFCGEAIDAMTIDSRMVLTNMAVEMGAKNGYMEPDDKTLAYLEGRARAEFEPVRSDPDAEIEQHLQYDISDLPPQIACPHAVDNVCSVEKVAGKKIDQVFFGSCTNARLEDFAIVAKVLDGKKIHPSTRLIVIPASSQVLEQALQSGYIDILVRAGATLVNSGCGPCMGNHEGVLAPQEVTLSTSNRNFKGRFGCKDAEIYLCSPLTAAVSALTGEITDFRSFTL